jgi:CspA family cold shock protein
MPTGTVLWYNRQKGRGYLAPDVPMPAGIDPSRTLNAAVFIYVSALERAGLKTLHEGMRLRYDIEYGDGGWNGAVALHVIPDQR